MKKTFEFKLGELFCGPGGIAWGASKAFIENNDNIYCIKHVWANDFHPDTCATYEHNFPNVNVICKNVKDLDINLLTDINCFAFGFPCNDFSIVGETKGFNGDYGGLYIYGVDVLNKFNPKFFLAENVSGLSSANDGKAFEKIINDLSIAGGNGYDLTIHKFKFEEYGIPQSRHRIIIVGINKALNLRYRVPAPITKNNPVTAKDALEKPPIPINSTNNELIKQSSVVTERLKLIKPGYNIWQTKLPDHLNLNVKGAKMSQIYKRLDPNKPSYTITGCGGGGTHGYHYSEPRALTNRERARIQTFPDDFHFIGKYDSVRRQIGMAVPPLASKIIFESILKTFAGVEYEFVEANMLNSSKLNLFNQGALFECENKQKNLMKQILLAS